MSTMRSADPAEKQRPAGNNRDEQRAVRRTNGLEEVARRYVAHEAECNEQQCDAVAEHGERPK
jgi:hypothetical protein